MVITFFIIIVKAIYLSIIKRAHQHRKITADVIY